MSGKSWVAAAFVVACVAQAGVPLGLVLREERTLAEGEVFRFRCAPVDPYDPFRGRYVALRFDVETQPVPIEGQARRGDRAFATLEVGEDGFARVARVTSARPAQGTAIPVQVGGVGEGGVRIRLPFDRYFLNEEAAPEAEAAYRDALAGGRVEVWAAVHVLRGRASLGGVYLDGVAIEERLR